MSLLSSETVPLDGFGFILLCARSVFVANAEIVLRIGVPLLGSAAVPFDGFGAGS